jgi:hypothetical protein
MTQPNYLSHQFPALTEAGYTAPFLAEMGNRNFPSKHTVSLEFGGTAKPTSVTYILQGSNKFDARDATDEQWFDIVGPVVIAAVPGDGEPAPHMTWDDAVAKWVRIRVTDITGGTDPTVTPTWAGVV